MDGSCSWPAKARCWQARQSNLVEHLRRNGRQESSFPKSLSVASGAAGRMPFLRAVGLSVQPQRYCGNATTSSCSTARPKRQKMKLGSIQIRCCLRLRRQVFLKEVHMLLQSKPCEHIKKMLLSFRAAVMGKDRGVIDS